jgi:hypothetical protein
MAVESIGALYPTKIPGLADAADIQAALRAYHYGSYAYDQTNTSTAALEANSIAKFLFDIETDIAALEARPSSGGNAQNTQPVPADFSPADIPDGYIWVDANGTLGGVPTGATAVFTNSAPTTSLTTGTIWVDKDATAITANPFIPTATINAKGDLLAGSANDSITVLSASTNGYVLITDSSTTSGLTWADSAASTQTLTNKSISLGSNTVTSTLAQLNTAISDADVASLAGTETLTNKTLTSPTISSITNTGTVTLPTTTDTLVGRATTDTLTNKTLTAPAISAPTITGTTKIAQILETTTLSTSAVTATQNYDVITNGAVTYVTASNTSNYTLNVRGDGSTTLNSVMSTGQALTIAHLVTNGATAYYLTTLQIDGTTSGVTTEWQGGTAPSSGNTNSVDIYSITIIKTGSATFTAFAAQTKFA